MIDKRLKSNNAKNNNFRAGRFLSSTFGFLIIILLGIVVGIAAGFLVFYLSMYVQARKGSIILPNYVNVDSQKAAQELKAKGFKVVVVGGDGKVIKMDPSPNVSVKIGREVKLFTENVKTVKLTLPDFKYCWYKSVERIMKELNIITSVKTVPGPGIYGTVVSTSPAPGSEVTSFQSIVLFISSGKGDYQPSQEVPVTPEATPEEAVGTTEPTGTTGETSGPVEIVPPSVDLDVPIDKPIQPEPEPQTQPQTQTFPETFDRPSETDTTNPQEGIEGGQF